MVQIGDQNPEVWAVLAQTYVDPDQFFPERTPRPGHLPLVRAIQNFLYSRHPRRAELNEVINAVSYQFKSVDRAQVSQHVRQLLQRDSHFDYRDGRYGIILSDASRRQQQSERLHAMLARVRRSDLTPIPFISPTTRDPKASSQAKSGGRADLWGRFDRLGTAPDYCHLWLTLEPGTPSKYTSRTIGIVLLADQEPAWFIYTLTAPTDALTSALRSRGWSSWMPHDHPGRRAEEYTAPGRWLRQPLNDIVLGAHVRTPHEAWSEFIALTTDVLHVTSDRIDAQWAPLDDEERQRLEQARALLEDAFTWVNQRTPGGGNTRDGYRYYAPETLGTCIICGHVLSDEESVTLGIGPFCRERVLERIGFTLDLTGTWNDAGELLERIVHGRRRIPLSHWAYARPLTLEGLAAYRAAGKPTRRHG